MNINMKERIIISVSTVEEMILVAILVVKFLGFDSLIKIVLIYPSITLILNIIKFLIIKKMCQSYIKEDR
jgi:hypothetical protein